MRDSSVSIKNSSFLVTGGCGFIGSHLVRELVRMGAKEVIVIDNLTTNNEVRLSELKKLSKVTLVAGDNNATEWSTVEKFTDKIDGIFHLAAASLAQCSNNPRRYFSNNVISTLNVAMLAINSKAKLVASSSASVYGDAILKPMDENHPLNNRNVYGSSKIAGESLLNALKYEQNLEYMALRYFNVYGPNQNDGAVYSGIISKMIIQMLKGDTITIMGDGNQSFDFVHVNDVVRANIKSMEANFSGESINVCTGIQTSINQIVEMLITFVGKKAHIKYATVNDIPRRTLVKDRVGSGEKAEKLLQFTTLTTLEEGLKDLVAYMKKVN